MSQSREQLVIFTHAGIGIGVDIALFGLPIWVIHRKMTFRSKAFKVILVFCVGLFSIITGITRFAFVVTSDFSVNTSVLSQAMQSWDATKPD